MSEASNPPESHPLWMTAQEWLDSGYYKLWNPDGKFEALFDLNRNQSESRTFPIYPVSELMFRIKEGWCYQPYGCGDTEWVYVKTVDYSEKLYLKSTREIIEEELTYKRYSIFTWGDKKAIEDLGISRTCKTASGGLCSRCSVTHQELMRILEVPELAKVWEKKQEEARASLSWHKYTPSKETPVKVYAAGGDDSSYTKLYETAEQAMAEIERFKTDGLVERPGESDGWYFTN